VSASALSTATHAHPAGLAPDDRCDRCGAQAFLYVQLASGGELLFCCHHARQYGPALRELAVNVCDRTATLTR
jgi:hypothetical protein